MRIKSIAAQDIPPIMRFEIDHLSDVVVIGGANGVGKTRLINSLLGHLQNPQPNSNIRLTLEATTQEEKEKWASNVLDTAIQEDTQKIREILRVNRRRNNMKSTILLFESNRTFQQVQALQYQFEFPDPFAENVGWSFPFGGLAQRRQDTQHAILKKIHIENGKISKRAVQLKRDGSRTMKLDFTDPLDMFKKPFRQLLAPKELVDANLQEQRLYYIDGSTKLSFDHLSSGESEIVNIVFDFILRNPNDTIVIFDEPELHLHPELIQKLVQTLTTVGNRNQFIFCTHSPSLITTSLEHTVVFVAPPEPCLRNQAVRVDEDDKTQTALRLLGHSIGVIALGSKIVFIEGNHTSLDKRVYSYLIRNHYPELVLVPSEGKDTLAKFSAVAGELLDKSVWGVEFYMLCDRDAAPTNALMGQGQKNHPNLKILERYHLENYFLDEKVLAHAFSELEPPGSWLHDPSQIGEKLREIGRRFVSLAVALKVSAQFRFKVGNLDIMPRNVHGISCDELTSKMIIAAKVEAGRISEETASAEIKAAIEKEYASLMDSLDTDTSLWKIGLPGRPVLRAFAKDAELSVGKLKELYLRKAQETDPHPFQEIIDVFGCFASGFTTPVVETAPKAPASTDVNPESQ